MTSPLTTPFSVMLEELNTQLENSGYTFDRSHVSQVRYLATALSGIRGTPVSELNMGFAALLCGIANASDGGNRSPSTSGVGLVSAACVDVLAGGGGGYTGPLDIVSGAVAAFSQRAMSSAKRGSALYTIDNGSTTQSFSSDATTGDAPVSSIASFVGGGTGTVALWNDQSGNGTNVLQGTKANQPTWKASATNSRPSLILGNTAPQNLSSSGNASLTGNGQTVFFVVKFTDITVTGNFLGIEKTTSDFSYAMVGMSAGNADGTVEFQMDAFDGSNNHESGGFSSDISLANTYGIGDCAWTFGSGSVAWNGVSYGNDNAEDVTGTPGAFSAQIIIGADATFATHAEMEILEVLIYPSVLSDGQRTSIRQNMATYYGISV